MCVCVCVITVLMLSDDLMVKVGGGEGEVLVNTTSSVRHSLWAQYQTCRKKPQIEEVTNAWNFVSSVSSLAAAKVQKNAFHDKKEQKHIEQFKLKAMK